MATTPDNTRRETIEAGRLYPNPVWIDYTNYRGERSVREIHPASIYFGSNEYHPDKQWLLIAYDPAKQAVRTFAVADIHAWSASEPRSDAALASAEPQAREANGKVVEAAETMGFAPEKLPMDSIGLTIQWPDGSETTEIVSPQAAAVLGYVMDSDDDDEPRPAPAPAAETDGLVERIRAELIAENKLALFDVARMARDMATLRAQLAARTQPPEIAEALPSEEALAKAMVKCWGYEWVNFEDYPAVDSPERKRFSDCYSSRLDAQDAARAVRRLLASTGSRQEPAALAEEPSGPRYLIRKRGSYYRPNAQGYTTDVAKAGLFSKERAEQEARVEPDIIRAIPLTPDLLAALRSQPASRVDENDAERLRREVAGVIQPASRDSGEAMREACAHSRTKAYRDHVSCQECGAIKTDTGWGVASRRWFSSRSDAEFFQKNGRLPTSHSGSAS